VIAYQRVALGRRVRRVVSVNQPGAREDVGRLVPVVMAVPPKPMPGVWQVGGVVHGGLMRAGHGVRQVVSC
jgi:hypothetical protein